MIVNTGTVIQHVGIGLAGLRAARQASRAITQAGGGRIRTDSFKGVPQTQAINTSWLKGVGYVCRVIIYMNVLALVTWLGLRTISVQLDARRNSGPAMRSATAMDIIVGGVVGNLGQVVEASTSATFKSAYKVSATPPL